MNKYQFHIRVTYEQFLPFYQGTADQVLVTDNAGRRIQLSGKHLKPFLTRAGISGYFELCVNDQGKFISLTRIN